MQFCLVGLMVTGAETDPARDQRGAALHVRSHNGKRQSWQGPAGPDQRSTPSLTLPPWDQRGSFVRLLHPPQGSPSQPHLLNANCTPGTMQRGVCDSLFVLTIKWNSTVTSQGLYTRKR